MDHGIEVENSIEKLTVSDELSCMLDSDPACIDRVSERKHIRTKCQIHLESDLPNPNPACFYQHSRESLDAELIPETEDLNETFSQTLNLDNNIEMMIEENGLREGDDSYDESGGEESGGERPLERWAPLGCAAGEGAEAGEYGMEMERLRALEEEQEQLNSSLLSLTTHFAQVQFRLKQIVDAPAEKKEILLKDLETFAFKGIPDVRSCRTISESSDQSTAEMSTQEHDAKMLQQRHKQMELIEQLKSQLEDLETYAYETGDAETTTSQVIEKQRIVIDQLKHKLDLNDLDQFNRLTSDELRHCVDRAIGQIVNPARVKEKLVEQLKTQIVDLERFIEFLQGESAAGGNACTCQTHGKPAAGGEGGRGGKVGGMRRGDRDSANSANLREQTITVMRQALTVLQIFAITQFGCGGKDFQRNLLKRTTKGNHWGDLRARLEMSVSKVIELQQKCEQARTDRTEYLADPDEPAMTATEIELSTVVRKDLTVALRDLLQHGLFEMGQSQSLVSFGCLPNRKSAPRMMHAWDLFLKYYEVKHGKEYNEEPIRKLSQCFALDMVGGKAITPKQTLLSAIEEVTSTHGPLKRSEDSQLKAFVCLGLNSRKLVSWLRILLRNNWLVEYYYQPWSYVVKTGFDDSLVSLERLTKLNFNLPTDLAVRPFKGIKDAF